MVASRLLLLLEGLDVNELAQLQDFIQDQDDIHKVLLTPRKQPLQDSELEQVLNRVALKREIACLLTEFEPDLLAQRVFGTVSVLKKVVEKYSRMKKLVGQQPDSVRNLLQAQDEVQEIKRLGKSRVDYWTKKAAEALREKDEAIKNSREDIWTLMQEHEDDKNGLQDHVKVLNKKLEDSQAQCRNLEGRLRQSRVEVADVMNFLGSHSQLFLNWPRLRDLLTHFRNGTTVPSEWSTMITVVANDDPGSQPPRFTPMTRPDTDDDEETKDSEDKSRAPEMDLTHDSSSGFSSSGSSKRKRSSGNSKRSGSRHSRRQIPDSVQDLPTDWNPDSRLSCRPASEPLMLSEDQARATLADFPVVWKKLRLDVKALMRSGILYPGAIEWLREDRPAHPRFPLESLTTMLTQMMFWNRLGETPWTKYVPRRYFQVVYSAVEAFKSQEFSIPYWGPLETKDEVQDLDLDGLVEDQDDDVTKDADFVPESEEDVTKNTVVIEDSPSGNTRKKNKRPRIPVTLPDLDDSHAQGPVSGSGSGSASGKKSGSKKKARTRSKAKPISTTLAKKKLSELSLTVITIIEPPGAEVSSWVHLGIRVKVGDSTTVSDFQTPGFPDYSPNRFDLETLKSRVVEDELRALLEDMPWRETFKSRPRELFFHKRKDLTADELQWMDDWMPFICGDTHGIGDVLHWISLGRSERTPEGILRIHLRRAKRHAVIRKRVLALQKKAATKVRASIWNEPGIWKYPNKICYWILMDPRHLKPGTNRRYSLKEQLQILDTREPAPTQWTICATDEERIAHLPEEVRRTLIPAGQRDLISESLTS